MYTLREYLQNVVGLPKEEVPSDEFYCSEADIALTHMANRMQDSLAAYSYTLVLEGWLSIAYAGREITLLPGDLYVYSPGLSVRILDGSVNYKAICLIADERVTLESPAVWNMIRTAYYPVVELGQPVVHLTPPQAAHFTKRMQEVKYYLGREHRFLAECLRTLHTLFLLDLRHTMEGNIGLHSCSERTSEIFTGFLRLLPRHFVAHHDISFYASLLNITPTHLSRVVRQVTGRTVVEYINQMLLMEAIWLLQTTGLHIAAIAERLHFADSSSFSRFFYRLKGDLPKTFREKKKF